MGANGGNVCSLPFICDDADYFLANMKVITAIYLNCRPDLHDEWLTTIDIDGDVEDSLVSTARHRQATADRANSRTSKHSAV